MVSSSIELRQGRMEESHGSISLAPSIMHHMGETIHPRLSITTGVVPLQSRVSPMNLEDLMQIGVNVGIILTLHHN